jgi:hypothetical protein
MPLCLTPPTPPLKRAFGDLMRVVFVEEAGGGR